MLILPIFFYFSSVAAVAITPNFSNKLLELYLIFFISSLSFLNHLSENVVTGVLLTELEISPGYAGDIFYFKMLMSRVKVIPKKNYMNALFLLNFVKIIY